MVNKVLHGDVIAMLKTLEDNSIDSIVTDPPYHLTSITKRFGKKGSKPASTDNNDGSFSRLSKGFMGKEWDGTDENGLGIAFDVEMWKEAYRVLKPGGYMLAFSSARTYHRMATAIEDAGFEIVDMIEWIYGSGFPKALDIEKQLNKMGKIEEAKTFSGFKSSLKPSHEPICLCRKPLSEKNFALNVLKWGTGGLNIDGCRIGTEKISSHNAPKGTFAGGELNRGSETIYRETEGRFPANLIISSDIAPILDEQSEIESSRYFKNIEQEPPFFYCAKASKKERGEDNNHPTVKPVKLMGYLCKLITPPNGTVLDLFAGSGTTGAAANQEGFNCILIEREKDYIDIINKRLGISNENG